MLFGTVDRFAIEAMVEPYLTPPSAVWGRMRVWCQGQSLGDYSEEHCALYPAYTSLKELFAILPSLWSGKFNDLTEADILDWLDALLFSCCGEVELADDRSLEQCQTDAEAFGKFSFLTNWGEQFDHEGKSFIFCSDGETVKVLNRSLQSQSHASMQAPLAAVQEAITQFCSWFEQQQARLSRDTEA